MSETLFKRPTQEEMAENSRKKREHIRESWVRAMEARLVRIELQKCYKYEGVNQVENCKELAERYLSMVKTHRVEGYTVVDLRK